MSGLPEQHDTRDVTILRRAVTLAQLGPAADPNPRVGCVLVGPDNEVLGEGWHRGAGTAHAEPAALTAARQAGRDIAGATAYVSLEPCNHTGRTGPCVDALIRAGVTRVVYAAPDPNPVACAGAATLRAAGVDTELVALPEATALNRYFAHAVQRGRPFVTWKFAATLDGRSAAADGTSQWITGEEARADVHRLRAAAGAIVVGTGTVLADDPHLTIRPGGELAERQPLRVVVGERAVPSDARVLDDAASTVICTEREPGAVLAQLHGRGIRHVWLEGGPTLAAGWLRAGAIDEVIAYIAPVLLGAGAHAVADLGIGTIDDALRLTLRDVTTLGSDIRLTLTPEQTGEQTC